MTHQPDVDAGERSPRDSTDRRSSPDRRSDARRQLELPIDEERRAEQERRQFLRRILGERRASWPPAEQSHVED